MRPVRLILCVSALALLCACGDNDHVGAVAREPRWDDGPAGAWYAGDFHVHTSVASNDTRYPDGSVQSFPETIRSVARERGMAFVVLTDHSNSAGGNIESQVEDATLWNTGPEFPVWDMAAGLSTDGFLMIDGSELSPVSTLAPEQCPNCPTVGTGQLTPVGHIGCVPVDLATFDRGGAFIDRPPGEIPGGSGIDQCHARGGFAIVNHPFYRVTPWIDYDWTSYAYDAIEVWNGSAGFASFDRFAYNAYLCDRLAGRTVVAVGGSDNHRTPLPYDEPVSLALGAPLGLPLTSVLADRLEWDAIVGAVRHGRTVIHEIGTFVDVRLFGASGTYLGTIGDTLDGAAGTSVTLWARGRSPRSQLLRIVHVAPDACTDRRQPGKDLFPLVQEAVVAAETACADGACTFNRQISVTLAPGLYYATVGDFTTQGLNARDIAVTNVVTVRANGSSGT